MKVCQFRCCFHRRPTVRNYPFPSTSHRRCQAWRRCGEFQQTSQRPFGRCRGQWLWMKVRRCWCCFHRRPTVHWNRIPSTSYRRCQGWRRCESHQQTTQRQFGQYRGQLAWMEANARLLLIQLHRCPTARWSSTPNTSYRRCQGWRRCGSLQQKPQRLFGPFRGQLEWMKVRRCR